ncbi:glycosyltransferase family 9 protein [Solimicrobium silvestre]|uniref:Glycosyltransferase family 9 (Heptosyltransferase) n=1 Tax=Solimicrobium silvestre TaxID=2099400 RepID=A0A2S9GYL1_9BURK|nr:glycosyltransferase family 9 protein [Solimicrobium silvestre]PRC92812.1 Glycosyltransferase family 9 (heptosyltransferase) [Solimicrobium silvestre]
MTTQLVPAELLQKTDKILFVAHLALGDFTYMQNCFRAFSEAYPHIKMHLWVDELRRTPDATQWDHLKKYSLYDWVNSCPMFDKIYSETYSPTLFKKSIQEARTENYPIVVSFAVHHRHRYVNLARKLSPRGFIVGQKKRVRFFDIRKHLIYRKLNAHIPAYQITKQHQAGDLNIAHISSIYAGWFNQLFNLTTTEAQRFPFVDIPAKWHDYAQQQFSDWGFNNGAKVVFLNGFSKSLDRSWPLERVFELATEMKKHAAWSNTNFIINVVPERMAEAKLLYANCQLGQVHLFSAEQNFFQLPAILSLCNLIISVETAVMHLANAVHVPVIALMRQTSPEWTPINAEITTIVKVSHRKAWIDEITVDQVVAALP